MESPDWEQILEMLPVGENEDMEDKRRSPFVREILLVIQTWLLWFGYIFFDAVMYNFVREMWLLMDLDDSGFLTLRELARGVPTITQVCKGVQKRCKGCANQTCRTDSADISATVQSNFPFWFWCRNFFAIRRHQGSIMVKMAKSHLFYSRLRIFLTPFQQFRWSFTTNIASEFKYWLAWFTGCSYCNRKAFWER